VSLVARYLEENGIPTVIIATARDIVENCGVPRLLFVDFPLGNPCGVPFDQQMQADILESALHLLETATEPRTTVLSPLTWPQGEDWKTTIFTAEQPFLEGEAYDNWMAAKERYKRQKAKAEGSDT
jgi:hypothetical protein